MRPDPDLAAAFEATWPAFETVRCGGFLVGRGAGAGGRVSSAIAVGPWAEADIDAAIARHAAWGQPPLFRAWDGDAPLIAALTARGMGAHIPTLVMAAPIAALTDRPIPPSPPSPSGRPWRSSARSGARATSPPQDRP
ncbi:hypothetical protein CP157_00362 [Paracoccus marcusii]|uniref:hypothetical protein n=1 Tax=Paracoccus marcusii TaxID=59779 RepID=UPI001FD49DA6|nr:hypothetical protein [Paracoccus marcusii]QXI62687.1 hypothetical protein CP157_00362 [Paracoccus marcusii]